MDGIERNVISLVVPISGIEIRSGVEDVTNDVSCFTRDSYGAKSCTNCAHYGLQCQSVERKGKKMKERVFI